MRPRSQHPTSAKTGSKPVANRPSRPCSKSKRIRKGSKGLKSQQLKLFVPFAQYHRLVRQHQALLVRVQLESERSVNPCLQTQTHQYQAIPEVLLRPHLPSVHHLLLLNPIARQQALRVFDELLTLAKLQSLARTADLLSPHRQVPSRLLILVDERNLSLGLSDLPCYHQTLFSQRCKFDQVDSK